MYLCPIDIAMLNMSGGFLATIVTGISALLFVTVIALVVFISYWETRIAINFSSHTEVYSCN